MADDLKDDQVDDQAVDQGTATVDGSGDSVQTDTGKTYTSEQLSGIIKRKEEQAARRILKELGIEDIEKGREALSQLAEWKKSQMSKEDALTAERDEWKEKAAAAQREKAETASRLMAYKLGVDDSYIDDVIKLLPDGEEPLEERMKAFLEKRPVYLKKQAGNIGGKTGAASVPDDVALKERMKAAMKR